MLEKETNGVYCRERSVLRIGESAIDICDGVTFVFVQRKRWTDVGNCLVISCVWNFILRNSSLDEHITVNLIRFDTFLYSCCRVILCIVQMFSVFELKNLLLIFISRQNLRLKWICSTLIKMSISLIEIIIKIFFEVKTVVLEQSYREYIPISKCSLNGLISL